MRTLLPLLCLLTYTGGGAYAQSAEAVLARMDQASPRFKGVAANLTMVSFTAVITDTTTENGTMKMQRLAPGDVRAIIDFSKQADSARVFGFQGKTVQVYYPNTKELQEYAVGKNANQFLLLGFGSSGKELSQSYQVKGEGAETVAGSKTTKLQLVPKDPDVKSRLSEVELWVPDDAAYPVQQKFTEPNGNYRRVTYSDIQLNPPISGALQLTVPKGTKKTKGQ
jgi:outer membrane lipoprotein-sorting protein